VKPPSCHRAEALGRAEGTCGAAEAAAAQVRAQAEHARRARRASFVRRLRDRSQG